MAVPRTRSALNEPIICDACALDPSNAYQLPTKRDVLLALQMKWRSFVRQHDRQVFPPVKDFVISVTEEKEEMWVLRANIDSILKTKTIRDKVLKLFDFWQGVVKALHSKKLVSSSFTESFDELFMFAAVPLN